MPADPIEMDLGEYAPDERSTQLHLQPAVQRSRGLLQGTDCH